MDATNVKSQKTRKSSRKRAPAKKVRAKKEVPSNLKQTKSPVGAAFYTKFEPSEDQRNLVRLAAAMGYPLKRIADLIINPQGGKPISDKTLTASFPKELETGREQIMMAVASTLVGVATDKKHPKCVTAAIFLSKVWGKMREPEPEWSEKKRLASEAENAPQEGVIIIEAELVLEEPKPTPPPTLQ